MSNESHRILRFLAAGVLNTGFGFASYAGVVLVGAPLWLAVGVSIALAFVFNFFSYGGLVFGSTPGRRLPRFLMFYIALGGMNFVSLQLMGLLGFGSFVAPAVLLPILAVVTYAGMRSFVFFGEDTRIAR
jgi:putative flippase GtrA